MIRVELPSIADELDAVDPRTSRLTPYRRDPRDATDVPAEPPMLRVVAAAVDMRGETRCVCGAEKQRLARRCRNCYLLSARGLV